MAPRVKKARNMGEGKLQKLWDSTHYEYKEGPVREWGGHDRYQCPSCGKWTRYVAKLKDTIICEGCFVHGPQNANG